MRRRPTPFRPVGPASEMLRDMLADWSEWYVLEWIAARRDDWEGRGE